MKIAFDLRRINNLGIGRYMKCLVEAILAEESTSEYLLILPPGAERAIQLQGYSAKIITPKLKYYSIQEQVQLPRILREHKVDLLHSPHFVLPLFRPCKTVVTIHDVIGITCKDDLGSSIGRLYYRGMISAAVRLADRIITVSEFSRDDIVRTLGIDRAKIKVVYQGISADFREITDAEVLQKVRAKYRIQHEYIIYAGIYKPRKNHAALLHAFQKVLIRTPDANLVLVGPLSEGQEYLQRVSAQLGILDNVIFTGVVDDDDLRALYSAAKVYACPSRYEGFGFTILEAMACGTPVVCNPATSLPEVGGDAAIYADPENSEEFANALYRVFTDRDLRTDLIEKGRVNTQRFKWGNAAKETVAIYQEILANSVAGVGKRLTLSNVSSKSDTPVKSD
jgi:glycosyltransferase involved in cell wall biosynthesis